MGYKQKRVIVLGNIQTYYSHFLHGTLEGAILNGAWAKPVQYNGRPLQLIKNEIDFIKPHFVFAHMIFGPFREDVLNYLADIRKRYGTMIIYHMGDARTTPRYPNNIDQWVDLGLVNHGQYESFSDIWSIPTIHWPYMCFQQKDIADTDKRFLGELAFTGDLVESKHHGARRNFIHQLKQKLPMKLYPTPQTGNTRFLTAELSSSSKGVLGMQMGTNIHLYQDVRPFQYCGAGAVYYHDQCEAIDKFFEPHVHYVPYERNNVNSLKEQYDIYSNDNEKRKNIRRNAFDYCQRYHSTKKRIKSVFDYFEGKDTLPIYKEDLLW
jgi:hypothetical protein